MCNISAHSLLFLYFSQAATKQAFFASKTKSFAITAFDAERRFRQAMPTLHYNDIFPCDNGFGIK